MEEKFLRWRVDFSPGIYPGITSLGNSPGRQPGREEEKEKVICATGGMEHRPPFSFCLMQHLISST